MKQAIDHWPAARRWLRLVLQGFLTGLLVPAVILVFHSLGRFVSWLVDLPLVTPNDFNHGSGPNALVLSAVVVGTVVGFLAALFLATELDWTPKARP